MTDPQGAPPNAPKRRWPLSTGWTLVLAIFTGFIGLLVPLTIYLWRGGNRTGAYIAGSVGGLIVLLVVIAIATGGNSKPQKSGAVGSPPAQTPPPPPAKPKPEAKAQFVMVVRQSACGADPGVAYINCHVAVRNKGTAAGKDPDVYVLVRYSDGSDTIIDNTTDPNAESDKPGGFTIYPHTTRVIYLQHSYNATSHDLVQAAASLDLNAKGYPYITCTTC